MDPREKKIPVDEDEFDDEDWDEEYEEDDEDY